MRPPEAADYAHGKAGIKNVRFVRIVVRDRGNTRQQVLDGAPMQALGLLQSAMLSDRKVVAMVNVGRPFQKVRVSSVAEARKQVEFEMVVRVDQSRQQKISSEINGRP